MSFQLTTAIHKIANLKKRIRAIQGGTSASKTISILMLLIAYAQSDETPTLTSVVSESFPHLRRGAMRDFLNIMEDRQYFNDKQWDKSNSTYTFENGSKIEFFSIDMPSKVRGPRRDRLFINEANNNPYEAFDQLEVRTKDLIFLDWNPTNEFWYYDQVANRTDCDHLILTYRDNEGLDRAIVDAIEQRKGRKGWWQVYGLGQLGEVEGKIYRDWEIIDELPEEAKLERVGLDFGYSNDPTSIVNIYKWNSAYIIDEICYRKGMLNKPIADILLNNSEHTLVIGDSAEPKSIDEIKVHGVNIIGSVKGADSVRNGISVVQDQKIFITKQSTNVIKEYRNYLWKTDKDGKITQDPEHEFSHSMDAIRYAITSLVHPVKKGVSVFRPAFKGYNRRG